MLNVRKLSAHIYYLEHANISFYCKIRELFYKIKIAHACRLELMAIETGQRPFDNPVFIMFFLMKK